jgi:hypothetical protein
MQEQTAERNNAVVALPRDKRDKIIRMLVSGEFPVDADIAKECDVPVAVVEQLLKSDTELMECRRQSERQMAQLIEQSSARLAINGRNEIARQKAQEFMLKKLMPEKYGDDASVNKSSRSIKRILFVKSLPTVDVDENGIPVAHSRSPLEPQVLESK